MSNVAPLPMPPDNNGRDGKGRFTKGTGNIGRPYGAKSRHQRDFSALIIAMIPRAAQAISDALDNRERWAAELIARLTLPSGLTIPMHGTEMEDVEKALNDGDLSPEQSAALVAVKKASKAISELAEHREIMNEILEKLQPR
ncbi:hypothetical protein LUI11_14695 [Bradyrhizobium diazoefficiens]|nr:hypothetical protein [Bradyrhizobium diazoefficiens]APO53341.1 hypothetical protein BD122_23735 [Bradyrhizobium diazoefficiens]MCD9295076.1 hypothetical protein [Bradyrhizobium diazoefficiens]MCD9813326.1 hypothetical protein [Bradyrhizobium diazoefficiens]MCD9829875.1 hypothetical protein [Bradyrhizobium diazoefficiens]MCD9850135.1 hypothetical protein [Bradyrhizobium diazoefficiens]